MPSERIQRQIDRLLDEAEAALATRDWAAVSEAARAVLAIDEANEDALSFLKMAEANGAGSPTAGDSGEPEKAQTPAPTLPASFAAGRYTVHGFLGEGGSKKVYLAHDTRLDRDVAVAIVEGLAADGLERGRREAQAVARLGDHPNIVGVFDAGEEDGKLYTVYQYMSGGSAMDLVEKAADHRLPLEQAMRIASQVCAALAFAHDKGVIHRDLKPANIFLDESGTAKLGDFGLAAALDRTRLTQAGTFLGTAAYMAPEQAMGQPADARSDLYSLGCVLYELITGRPPFVGDDTVAVVTQQLNTPPITPSWHRPEVSPGLEALVLRLLEKDPAKRPANAKETAEALSASTAQQSTPVASGLEPRASDLASDPLYRTVFVGREAELRQLQSAFDAALSGNGGLVMVVGEPGIGKTSVCEQLATYAAMRGGRTLRGHCYEEGSLSLPYLPFVEAMRTYVLDRDPEALRSELGSNAPYVARIVSEVRDKLAVEQPEGGDPEDDRWRLLQGVTTFLRNAANVQPLVIVLEDLHWADKGTLDVLTHIARSLEGARMLIIGTYRDVEVDRSHALSGALAELRRFTNFSRVTLRGLGADDVQNMLATIAARAVPWALAEQVHRQTEGNPLFVQEVLRYLVEEGFLQRNASGELHQPGSDISLAMQIPEGLRDVIGKRLSRLGPETNKVLAVAAVIGRDFRLDVLQDVAAVTEEELYAALEEASGKGVLEERRQQGALGYRFTHAFLRQTLYEEIFTPRRIRTHQQVARAMETRYASKVADHAAELAEHFAQSTDSEDLAKAVHYGELAAQRAMGVYAYAEAARLLEGALQAQEVLDPDDKARRCDLLLALCEALLPGNEVYRILVGLGEQAFQLASTLADSARQFRVCRITREAFTRAGAGRYEGTALSALWLERARALATPGSVEEAWTMIALAREAVANGDAPEQFRAAAQAAGLAERLGEWGLYWTAVGYQVGVPFHEQLEVQAGLVKRIVHERAAFSGVRMPALLFLGSLRHYLVVGDRAGFDLARREVSAFADQTRDSAAQGIAAWAEITGMLLDGRLGEADGHGSEVVPQLTQFAGGVAHALNTARRYLGLEVRPLAEMLGDDHGLAISPLFESLMALPDREGIVGDGQAALGHATAIASLPGAGSMARMQALDAAVALKDPALLSLTYDRTRPLVAWGADTNRTRSPGRLHGEAGEILGLTAEARSDYEIALDVSSRLRNRPEIALIRLRLARLLFAHYPDERDDALAHLDFAIGELSEMKMAPALEEAMQLRLELSGADRADPNSSIVAVSRLAQAERPDLSRVAAPDGTVTLLFSDIENSTALNEQMGDAKWMAILRAHNAVIDAQVDDHGGHVVKTMGDGYMVAFKSPADGLRCAIAIQKALGPALTPNPSPDATGEGSYGAVRVRIGLHTGEMVREGDDFFGRHVNLAARVAGHASGGEIFVSGVVRDLVSGQPFAFDDAGERPMKGFEQPVRVWAARWA